MLLKRGNTYITRETHRYRWRSRHSYYPPPMYTPEMLTFHADKHQNRPVGPWSLYLNSQTLPASS